MTTPHIPITRSKASSCWSQLGLCSLLLAGSFIGCNGEATDSSGSGGQAPATGGNQNSGGGPSGSGGANTTTGGAATAGEGGMQGGAAGAPALPDCGCDEDSTVTIELLAGTRVYDLVAEHTDNCNPLLCQPETAYATYGGAPPSRYSIRACHPDGECIWIRTGFLIPDTNQGRIVFTGPNDETVEEPILIDAEVVEGDGRDVLEFSFEADESETDVAMQGSGRVCFADSEYVCLK